MDLVQTDRETYRAHTPLGCACHTRRHWRRRNGNLLLRPSLRRSSSYSCSTLIFGPTSITDRVTIIANANPSPWPWPMTLTLNPRPAMAMTHTQAKTRSNVRTDGRTLLIAWSCALTRPAIRQRKVSTLVGLERETTRIWIHSHISRSPSVSLSGRLILV